MATRRKAKETRSPPTAKKPALGLDQYRERWNAKAREHDDFPSGYFETDDGTMVGLRIVSSTTGMGDAGGDTLLGRIQRLVTQMNPASYQPRKSMRRSTAPSLRK